MQQHVRTKVRSRAPAEVPVGDLRRFGPDGVVYEVVGDVGSEPGTALIRLVESGETASYPIGLLLADPTAR